MSDTSGEERWSEDRTTFQRIHDVLLNSQRFLTVQEFAERANCSETGARNALEQLSEMRIAEHRDGRPVQYRPNHSYVRWKRAESLAGEHSPDVLREQVDHLIAEDKAFQEEYGVPEPDAVSTDRLSVDAHDATHEYWEDLSDWRTVRRDIRLLQRAVERSDSRVNADVNKHDTEDPGVVLERDPGYGHDGGGDSEKTWAIDRSEPQETSDQESRFQPLVETAPVPVAVITADRGIVYCNRKVVELLGANDRSAVLGQDPERFVHPEHRDRASRRICQVLKERKATEPIEYRLVGFDDQERYVEIAAAPVDHQGEPGAYILINDVTEFKRSQQQLRGERRFLETVMDTFDDIVYVLNADGNVHLWNETLVETTGYSHDEIDAMHAKEFIPVDQHEYVPGLMETMDSVEDQRIELDLLTKDDEPITHEFMGTSFKNQETGEVFRCGVARDMTEWLERERQLERQRDDLATLARINRILLETTRELLRTADREAIERTVCTHLSESDFYQFVWIGERAFDGDHIISRTTAGDGRGFLNTIEPSSDQSDRKRSSVDLAMQTGDVQVVRVDDPGCDPWQDAARECGFSSVAAVPLRHEETVYGVLLIHTERDDAFTEREQEGFDVLGRTVGFIINAVKDHRLLFTETVVELEFQATNAESLFVDLAADLDCDLVLTGYVASGRQWILYFDVDGAPARDVVSITDDIPRVERARVVSATDGEDQIEIIGTDLSLMRLVSHGGVSVRTAVACPDGVRMVVEAPVDADVREIVEHVQREYPVATLLAQRNKNHDVTMRGRPHGMLDNLTNRQREALEAAYRSGYFAWPRRSTAEEVASALDLSASTLHGHLRKAEERMLSRLFEEE